MSDPSNALRPERFGEPQPQPCRNPKCHRGWLGTDEEGRPIPCADCKPHLAAGRRDVTDYAERVPSARAQAAIDAAERENR